MARPIPLPAPVRMLVSEGQNQEFEPEGGRPYTTLPSGVVSSDAISPDQTVKMRSYCFNAPGIRSVRAPIAERPSSFQCQLDGTDQIELISQSLRGDGV